MDSNKSEGKESNEDPTGKPAIILKIKVNRFACAVCPCSYKQRIKLKYHIRRNHFNLVTKITGREMRKINDVWLEKVRNSDAVIEITKTAHNKYFMRKSDRPLSDVVSTKRKIDLKALYPDCYKPGIELVRCGICKESFLRRDSKKHFEKDHDELNI